jgi:hypothetical protein
MEIHEIDGTDAHVEYEVTFEERRLEDLRRINKLKRRDEKPFEAVAKLSAIAERAYAMSVRPFVRPLVNEGTAELGRLFHPLRWQRWGWSDLNPLLWPLPAFASYMKAGRRAVPADNPYRRTEKAASGIITAWLDLYRDLRDAALESLFFAIYGPAAILAVEDETTAEAGPAELDPRNLPLVREALATIGTGGYPQAIALIGALVGRKAERIPLDRLELVERIVRSDEILSELSADEVRRIKAEQAVIAELEPELGLKSLSKLLADPEDRRRALAVLDEAVVAVELTTQQRSMLDRVLAVLGAEVAKSNVGRRELTERELSATV